MNEKICECTIDQCDVFDFMAHHVGMLVLHPGGLNATRKLARSCHLDKNTRVVDIACGKGTSAIFLAENYGCNVVGIDISADLIAQANELAAKKGLEEKVSFRLGDALDLPFKDNEFDAAVSQAMLILVKDKQKSIKETLRVVKKGGYIGWLELSWKKPPSDEFLNDASSVLCASCMKNAQTYQGWEKLFKEAGVKQLKSLHFDMENNSIFSMVSEEGLVNASKIMFKYITNSKLRKRMNTMSKFFKQNDDYFGYGIYTAKK